VVAAASTFMVDGQQQVAILVGARGLPNGQKRTVGVSANNSRILVYKAGGTATLPNEMSGTTAAAPGVRINPPLLTASNETVASGEALYASNCAMCHGQTGVPAAGATAPDLRYSALLASKAAYNGAVREGDRAQRGMPSFARLTAQQTDDILAYIIKRANDEKAAQEAAVRRN
jgi:quinohemoprotein ethanol dehydrogenase